MSKLAARCRRKFLRYFPEGFGDKDYCSMERNYKWEAHERWAATLDKQGFQNLLRSGDYTEIAARAVAIEARTNLLFSFEKMALRDAVKSKAGARSFAEGCSRCCTVMERLANGSTRGATLYPHSRVGKRVLAQWHL
jgi:hypothetical protein